MKFGSACSRMYEKEFYVMLAFWILLLLTGLGFTPKVQAASEILAEVDGAAITSDEVEKPLAPQLSKLEEQI